MAQAASVVSRLARTAGRQAASTVRGVLRSRLADSYPQETVDEIFAFALRKQTGVSLKYMLDFGANPIQHQMILSAQFLHRELPVRLARRVAELENLPYGLSSKPHVLKVRDWYIESFLDLRKFPPVRNAQDELKFTELLQMIYSRHTNVVPLMAKGVAELRHELASEVGLNELPEIHQFLDGFYMSRIGIRFLIGQHIELHAEPMENHIGMIYTKCSPWKVSQDAIDDARSVCQRKYGSAPEVEIYGDPTFVFAYVPSHIHSMVFELVKNSLRAVNDLFEEQGKESPAIRLVVAEGAEEITIKVSDEGGGIPRSDVPRIFTYLYSTAASPLPFVDDEGSDGPTVLAGYGYGLPLSRLYARYFGGDLQVISMDGYGTDAYLHLNRLGNMQEPLP
ncbi:unnamed protein product [Ostreobium quekettii]|uniref:Protein-serine/threonine kinase n=1 Tax=Ostreobium quekettii TaxID=121088 RepID=A0A8S1JIW8_9CHLO|nr:unnamed protein product [Ostreobium quekettii]|eukprot:evm.model.scf_78.7 EVM.evm.TU.scf_78.7   scf_78:121063-124219(-)